MTLSRYTSQTNRLAAFFAAFAFFVSADAANATGIYGSSSMKELGRARAPIGHVEFCTRLPSECEGTGRKGSRIAMNAVRFDELERVNRSINAQIAPVTDLELYGVEEHWTYPVDRGDCEDYVLLKRRTLISLGWNASALLVTVVRDLKGAGHAVLTVATDRGDLVLDNQQEGVMPWQLTGYEYIKRQSQTSPKDWVYVGPARSDVGVASTRNR